MAAETPPEPLLATLRGWHCTGDLPLALSLPQTQTPTPRADLNSPSTPERWTADRLIGKPDSGRAIRAQITLDLAAPPTEPSSLADPTLSPRPPHRLTLTLTLTFPDHRTWTGTASPDPNPDSPFSPHPFPTYDLIFIDGRLRVDCAAIARLVLAPGGLVLLHDAHRENYRGVFGLYRDAEVAWNTAAFSTSREV